MALQLEVSIHSYLVYTCSGTIVHIITIHLIAQVALHPLSAHAGACIFGTK